jgi:uncharacterized Rmd1/YagE family protein
MNRPIERERSKGGITEPLLPVTAMNSPPMKDKTMKTKANPKRTTKTSQKLKIFPEGITQENLNAPQDEWISSFERKHLPRVTGYCTANSYKMDILFDDLKSKYAKYHTNPKRLDEVIYTPFSFHTSSTIPFSAFPDVSRNFPTFDPSKNVSNPSNPDFFTQNIDVFLNDSND